METQINEIMRSLGRIEQKTDSTIDSLNSFKGEIKEVIIDHSKRISYLETSEKLSSGKVNAIIWVWSGIVSGAVALVAAFMTRK